MRVSVSKSLLMAVFFTALAYTLGASLALAIVIGIAAGPVIVLMCLGVLLWTAIADQRRKRAAIAARLAAREAHRNRRTSGR